MNWANYILSQNQWTVLWLGFWFTAFVILYIADIKTYDRSWAEWGKGNPMPTFLMSIIGVIIFAYLVIGLLYVVDWIIWMWNS
jgi:hypothetical protein